MARVRRRRRECGGGGESTVRRRREYSEVLEVAVLEDAGR
jgi:hypothetical protein